MLALNKTHFSCSRAAHITEKGSENKQCMGVCGGEGLLGADQPLNGRDCYGFTNHLPTGHFLRRQLIKMLGSETYIELVAHYFNCKP